MHAFRNSLEGKNADKRKSMRQKDIKAKEEIIYESVFIHLKT